ncbi:MAG: DASH family cryptochrome [Aquabacterium sp.]
MNTVIHWFRHDLRLADNPAFSQAVRTALAQRHRLLPVYIWNPAHTQAGPWVPRRMGLHRMAVLADTLSALDTALQARGSRLLVLRGPAVSLLPRLAAAVRASQVTAEEIAAPEEQEEAEALRRVARSVGWRWTTTWQSSLLEPAGLPFPVDSTPDVFTAFRQQVERAGVAARVPLAAPAILPPLPADESLWDPVAAAQAASGLCETCGSPPLCHTPMKRPVASVLPPEARSAFPYHLPACAPGEAGAQAHLAQYLHRKLPHSYKQTRNGLIGVDYSSKLSPWLASGALSAPQVMHALRAFEAEHGASDGSYWLWFELLWRDHFRFMHLKHGRALYRARGLSERPPPQHDAQAFQRWCEGQTGHALVDAGLRELRLSGFLSNRMRQVVASYLVHDLNCDWRAGAAWFESQLVDHDVYSNQGNWLYVAGRGTDPRGGRRFNPDKQASDHDPDGAYRRLWGTA